MLPAIHISGVSKKYRLGKIGSGYFFREIERMLRMRFTHRTKEAPGCETVEDHVYALDNITLSVARGESVGIVGRNGSGKSTLLKLLAGVTLPSAGTIEMTGRVASLLDIGTGFQSDLSARENIFLNGAVLGMRRGELVNRFDDIVAFSGIGRFLDTPVKRFSSGMYIRLAFSIAIHCVADILLVDEILAAADRSFLERCRIKMKEYAAAGTTMVMVSHNLQTIRELCPRTILLANGAVAADDATSRVLTRYREGHCDAVAGATKGNG